MSTFAGQDGVCHAGATLWFSVLRREGDNVSSGTETVATGGEPVRAAFRGGISRGQAPCVAGAFCRFVGYAGLSESGDMSADSIRSHCHGARYSASCGITPKVSPDILLGFPKRGDIQVR